jgi:acyl carrier protein
MEVCTICREETEAGEPGPDGRPVCPPCARLLRWFWAHFDAVLLLPKGGFLSPDTAFDELAADSLDTVEWIVEAQEQFGVMIGDLDTERMQTVADYLRYIRLHAKKEPSRESGGRDPLWDRELDG